jgi:hypothetical protein
MDDRGSLPISVQWCNGPPSIAALCQSPHPLPTAGYARQVGGKLANTHRCLTDGKTPDDPDFHDVRRPRLRSGMELSAAKAAELV